MFSEWIFFLNLFCCQLRVVHNVVFFVNHTKQENSVEIRVDFWLPFHQKRNTTLLGKCQSLARNKVYVLFFFLFVFDCSVSAKRARVSVSICCRSYGCFRMVKCFVFTVNETNVLVARVAVFNPSNQPTIYPSRRSAWIHSPSTICALSLSLSLRVTALYYCLELSMLNFPLTTINILLPLCCRWAQFTWFYIIHITVFWLLH